MTEEELEREAREDVDSLNGVDLVSSTMVAIDKYGAYKIGRYDGYLASAEPREKRIADLEKENAELRTKKIPQLERKIASIRGCHSVDTKKLKARIEQVERLREENAKAKELLKRFIELDVVEGFDIVEEAEQFLSEVEK